MLLTIISFLFVFTVITIVHEFGHLYFSKKAGIRVHEFGIGFGPTIFSKKINNTTYKISLLPILGYIKIAGMDTEAEEEAETPENEKYCNKTTGQKFISIVAGPLMNLLLGFLIFSFVFMFTGIPSGITNEVATISPGSEAAKIGLQAGDRIIKIDNQKITAPEAAIETIHQSANKELTIIVERGAENLVLKATPKLHERLKIGLIGFSLKPKHDRVGPFKAIYFGLKETAGLSLLIVTLLGKMVTGQIALGDLAGPVGIAQITGQYAHQGILSLLTFLAFFSINVAVLNLLPLPALDGGRLFFLIIEAIRRKPVDIELENKIHTVGLYLFLLLFAVLTINDFMRIFGR